MSIEIVLLLIVFPELIEGQLGDTCVTCPDAWIYFDGSCYLFDDNLTVPWKEAVHHCDLQHSHLVVVDNRKEDEFLHIYALKLFKNVADRKAQDLAFWMGATDTTVEGLWTWYTGKSALPYVHWAPGQPDSHGGVNEDCMFLYGASDFTWHDASCNLSKYPLCEKRILDPTTMFG